MTDIEIRKILEALYRQHRMDADAYIMKTELRNIVGCSPSELKSDITYLEERNYVQVEWTFGGDFAARIRAEGIDFLLGKRSSENPQQPYVHVEQKHYGTGPMFGYVGPQSSIEIENSFNEIYKELEERDLPEKERSEVQETVEELEKELKKDNPSRDNIRKIVDFLKRNSNWIVPIVEKVIEKILGPTHGG